MQGDAIGDKLHYKVCESDAKFIPVLHSAFAHRLAVDKRAVAGTEVAHRKLAIVEVDLTMSPANPTIVNTHRRGSATANFNRKAIERKLAR